MLLVDTTMGIASNLVEVRPPANEDLPDSPPKPDALLASYYELRDRIVRERDAGNYPEAFRLCDRALSLAEQVGDETIIDQAYCNRFGYALAAGSDDVSFSRLREILMRNRSIRTSFTAAYHLAFGYMTKKEYKKALFYAQVARDRAYAVGDTDLIARSHGEIGRFYLCESYFDRAVAEFEAAIATWHDAESNIHPAVLCNMGYAKLLLGEYTEGFSYLFKSLRHCRSRPSENAHEWTRLFLCFGYIELRKWRYAWRHGCIGLKLAQESGDRDAVKCALYLLGELEKSVGDMEAAYDYFSQLQKDFYPDVQNMPEVMLCCEARELVNLRA